MDRLEAMSVLVQAVETGSFTAAAKALRMPLPTVSRKVSELERRLGARLLVRTTRKLALTDAGEAYVASARRILDEVEAAERAAAGEFTTARGELILTAPLLFGQLHLLPIVTAFLAAYPDIDVRLLLSDRNLHLVEDQVDLALRIGRLPDSGLVGTRVGSLRQVICASPELLARHGAPRVPAELAALPRVSFEGPAASWTLQGPGADAAGRSRLSVSTAEAAVRAAELGVGVARVLHYQCAAAVRAGSLELVLEAFEPDPLPVTLLHAPGGALPLKMRAFLDFAAPRLRRDLESLARG